jgi:hypothetical protein
MQLKREYLKQIIKSIIRESIESEPVYVEYKSQMRDEVPFTMDGKKFEYVWAKYPGGKTDIGVYAFSGDVVYSYKQFRKMFNINENEPAGGKNKIRTYYQVDTYDLSRTSRDPDAEREDVYQVKKITSDVQGDEYDEVVVGEYETREEAERVCYKANLSIGRVPKSPTVPVTPTQPVAKLSETENKIRTYYQVDTYDLSRTSRDPDAEREDVYQVKKITSDVQGDEYEEVVVGEYETREEAERVCNAANISIGRVPKVKSPQVAPAAAQLSENYKETFSKRISGTVGVDGAEYDYSAVVTVNVVTTRQAHGEDYSEIDTEGADIQIEAIVPEPDKMVASKVDEAIYDDVHGRNMWDFVNESDMVKETTDTNPVKAAKDWILDCAVNPEDEENITHWLSTATDEQVKKYVNRTFDGGWNGFLNTL